MFIPPYFCFQMQEMDAMRIAEELKKQQTYNESNRMSKDSGVVDIELIRPSHSNSSRLSAPEYMHHGTAGPADPGQIRSTSLTELDKGVYLYAGMYLLSVCCF